MTVCVISSSFSPYLSSLFLSLSLLSLSQEKVLKGELHRQVTEILERKSNTSTTLSLPTHAFTRAHIHTLNGDAVHRVPVDTLAEYRI